MNKKNEELKRLIRQSQQEIEKIKEGVKNERGWENIAFHTTVMELRMAIRIERSKITVYKKEIKLLQK